VRKLIILTSALAFMGCAHGFSASLKEELGQPEDEIGQQMDDLTAQGDGEISDLQDISGNSKHGSAKKPRASGKTKPAAAKSAPPRAVVAPAKAPPAEAASEKASASSNASFASAIAAKVVERMPLIADTETLLYANTVGRYVAQELVPSLKCHDDGTPWNQVRVAVVRSAEPSSFSIPGGFVFVTTALVQKIGSEDEFAGVLANEIVASICEKGVPSNLSSQASSGWSDYIASLPTKAQTRADLAFADRYALVTLYRRGYDVSPYVNFVEKNETSGRHAWGPERAAVLKKIVAATPRLASTSSARLSRWQSAKAKAN
jgi:hypothetical protein